MKKVWFGMLTLSVLAWTVQPASAEEKKGTIGLLVSGNIPVGDFSDVNKPGFGGLFQVSAAPASVPELSLGGTVGVMRFSGQEVSFVQVGARSAALTIVPLLAAAQYTFPTESKTKPYVHAGVGIYVLKAGKGVGSKLFGDPIGDISTTRFGLATGGGFLTRIAPATWFNVQVTYHYIDYRVKNAYEFFELPGSTSFLNILAGVSVAFGR